jgi:hypothetical protein
MKDTTFNFQRSTFNVQLLYPGLNVGRWTLNVGRSTFLLLLVTTLLNAQVNVFVRDAPGPPPGTENRGVYVRDSGPAAEKLALAQRMEHLKEWDKAADIYQEIIEKYSDQIVSLPPAPFPSDAAGVPRYSNVTMVVQERIANWGTDALAAYHRHFEPAAATLLHSLGADDVGGLNRVCSLYFATTAGKTAALRLIELYIENGDFLAAGWLGERLLAHHPELLAERPKVLFRTALAEHLAGNEVAAGSNLAELKKNHAGAVGSVRGKDVALAEELERMLKQPAPVPQGMSADSWPTVGGDVGRGRISDAGGRVGAKQHEIPLSRRRLRSSALAEIRGRLGPQLAQGREAGLDLGIMPVVDRGELFFQDNVSIYAVGVESGLSLPGWATTYQGEQRGRYSSPNPGVATLPLGSQMTVTVTDSAVLAVMRPFEQMPNVEGMGLRDLLQAGGETRLVCLDRKTGAEKWVAIPQQFAQANLRGLEMAGSPLVVGDNVYVGARGGKPLQFDDAYVLCFSLGDGKLRWACYLASGNAMAPFFENRVGILAPTPSHLAYAGGRVYACTEFGAQAAVDA